MDLSHITSQSLRRVLNLTERKDELISLVSELEAEIAKSLTGARATFDKAFLKAVSKPVAQPANVAKKPAKAPTKAGKGKRGGLKDRILALLASAGDNGLRVKDIASKLGTSTGNVSVWFSTTGKSLTKKLQPGRYAISAGMVGDIKPAGSPAPAAKAPARKKRGLTAAGRARLSASMSARWAKRRAANAPVAKKGSKPSKA